MDETQLGNVTLEQAESSGFLQSFIRERAKRLNVDLDRVRIVARRSDSLVTIVAEDKDEPAVEVERDWIV